MKCHLRFTSTAAAWRICSTPGWHRLAQGVLLWRGLWEGGDTHEGIKTPPPLPQSSGAVFAMSAVAR